MFTYSIQTHSFPKALMHSFYKTCVLRFPFGRSFLWSTSLYFKWPVAVFHHPCWPMDPPTPHPFHFCLSHWTSSPHGTGHVFMVTNKDIVLGTEQGWVVVKGIHTKWTCIWGGSRASQVQAQDGRHGAFPTDLPLQSLLYLSVNYCHPDLSSIPANYS